MMIVITSSSHLPYLISRMGLQWKLTKDSGQLPVQFNWLQEGGFQPIIVLSKTYGIQKLWVNVYDRIKVTGYVVK